MRTAAPATEAEGSTFGSSSARDAGGHSAGGPRWRDYQRSGHLVARARHRPDCRSVLGRRSARGLGRPCDRGDAADVAARAKGVGAPGPGQLMPRPDAGRALRVVDGGLQHRRHPLGRVRSCERLRRRLRGTLAALQWGRDSARSIDRDADRVLAPDYEWPGARRGRCAAGVGLPRLSLPVIRLAAAPRSPSSSC